MKTSRPEDLVHQHIETATRRSRRELLTAGLGVGVLASLPLGIREAFAKGAAAVGTADLAARPPSGFTPFSAPGVIAKVKKANSLMPNGYYPKEDDARGMLTRVMKELTGKSELHEAVALFVHPEDKVCVKVNGIALKNFANNKELVIPFLEAMIKAGVNPENITLLEQYKGFFDGTRLNEKNIPNGVKISIHGNANTDMDFRMIPGTGVKTKFCRYVTEATAIINFSLIKDHSICGYTGQMKNLTHGTMINPSAYHSHHASPQIALLYAQDVIRSRVRLHIADGFKIMADGGPVKVIPDYVMPHESVYATTDAVAMDALGWSLVEEQRKKLGLKSLTEAGRIPAYIRAAADLGIGIDDLKQIRLNEATI